jgi:hypothetical protein
MKKLGKNTFTSKPQFAMPPGFRPGIRFCMAAAPWVSVAAALKASASAGFGWRDGLAGQDSARCGPSMRACSSRQLATAPPEKASGSERRCTMATW